MKSPSAAVMLETPPLVVPEDAIEVLSRDFEVTPTSRLLVNVPRANIQLRPGRDRHIEIRIYVAGCDHDAAYAYLDDMRLRTRLAEDVVRVKPDRAPRRDTDWWRRLRAREGTMYVDLRLPTTCNVDLQATAGAIDAADLGGKIALDINGGQLRTENLQGQLEVFARSSDVAIRGFTGEGAALNIYTSPLHLDGAQTSKLNVEAAASPLDLRNLDGTTCIAAHGGSTQLRTVRGTLRASAWGGPLSVSDIENAETELTASGGNITIAVPSSVSADVSFRASQIHLDTDLPFSGDWTPNHVDGQLNGGGTALHAQAHRGTIRCERA